MDPAHQRFKNLAAAMARRRARHVLLVVGAFLG
jgi:hypothetical protein